MNRESCFALLEGLRTVFDVVRLVDAEHTTQLVLGDDQVLRTADIPCYAIWSRIGRCKNCTSRLALLEKGRRAKFELVNDEMYYIVSRYVELDGADYTIEMVNCVSNEMLFGTDGDLAFADKLSNYGKKVYSDGLTGAYNRRYYEEKLAGKPAWSAIAMVDVDLFKEINDRFGHPAGDEALKAVVSMIQQKIRNTDEVIRYGGDEFLIAFNSIDPNAFAGRLEEIRAAAERMVIEMYPLIRLTVSVGGICCPEMQPIELTAQADRLLYQAKKQRNTVCVWDGTCPISPLTAAAQDEVPQS